MSSPLALNFDILHQVFDLNSDDIPTLRCIAETCVFGVEFARKHMFKHVRLPVGENYVADVLALVDAKPYLAIVARAVRLSGVARDGGHSMPLLDLGSVDEILGVFPLADEIEVRGFEWMRSDEILVNKRTDMSLAMHTIYGHSPTSNPVELALSLDPLYRLSMSDIRLHDQADPPMEFEGNVSATVVSIACVDDVFRNALDGLLICDVAELSYTSMQHFHVSMMQFTVGFGSWEALSRLTLEVSSRTWPASEWRNADIGGCVVLEELVIVVQLNAGDRDEDIDQEVALYSIVEQAPPSLRYLDIVFCYEHPGKMTSYSAQATTFDWQGYDEMLTTFPALLSLGLSLVHQDLQVGWQQEDVRMIENIVEAVPVVFYAGSSLNALSWWY